MTCTECQDRILDALTETTSAEARAATEAHLASCPRCRQWAAETRTLWGELGALPRPVAPVHAVPGFLAAAGKVTRRRDLGRSLAYAAGLLLVFWAGRSSAPAPSAPVPAAPPALPTWLLLLREPAGAPIAPPGSAAEAEVVREYGAWAGALAEAGRLLGAEKLADPAMPWLPAALPAEATTISGFFLVRAADSAEATRIALESPHVRRGGTIELRRIDPT